MSAPPNPAKMAEYYLSLGMSVIPTRNKVACIRWKRFQERPPTTEEIKSLWRGPRGIAIVCGKVSGNFQAIDCDRPDVLETFLSLADDHQPSLRSKLLLIRTPSGGYHLPFRCEVVGRNEDLALYVDHSLRENEKPDGTDERGPFKVRKIFETRAEGGYLNAPGGDPRSHPTGKPYVTIQGSFESIPILTPDQRELLLTLARGFNEYVKPKRSYTSRAQQGTSKTPQSGLRPGDDYNQRGDVLALLQSHGWKIAGRRDHIIDLRRPGKKQGHSATLNAVGHNCFYSFSHECAPFEFCQKYNAFSVFTLLTQGSIGPDQFKLAAKELANQGYGDQIGRKDTDQIKRHGDNVGVSRDRYAAQLNQIISAILTVWDLSDENKVTFFAIHGIAGNRLTFNLSMAVLAKHIREMNSDLKYSGTDEKAYRNAGQFGRRRLTNLRRALRPIGLRILTTLKKGGTKDPKTGKRQQSRFKLDMSVFRQARDEALQEPDYVKNPGRAIHQAADRVARRYYSIVQGSQSKAGKPFEKDAFALEQQELELVKKHVKKLFDAQKQQGLTTADLVQRWRHLSKDVEEKLLQKLGSRRIAEQRRRERLARDASRIPGYHA